MCQGMAWYRGRAASRLPVLQILLSPPLLSPRTVSVMLENLVIPWWRQGGMEDARVQPGSPSWLALVGCGHVSIHGGLFSCVCELIFSPVPSMFSLLWGHAVSYCTGATLYLHAMLRCYDGSWHRPLGSVGGNVSTEMPGGTRGQKWDAGHLCVSGTDIFTPSKVPRNTEKFAINTNAISCVRPST